MEPWCRVLLENTRTNRWLSFEDKALTTTFGHYRCTVEIRDTALEAVELDLSAYFDKEPFAHTVWRLGAYRGISHVGALCLGAEVFDRRRFPGARTFMCFTSLTCSERSRPRTP
jgi:hypothetical protein